MKESEVHCNRGWRRAINGAPPFVRGRRQSAGVAPCCSERFTRCRSRSVGESAMLLLHFGGRYRPDTSRQRHDYATIRAAMQRSKAVLKENQKTVAKWRKRAFVTDARIGPKAPRSTVSSAEEEPIVALRKPTVVPRPMPLCRSGDVPALTRSPAHR